MTRTSGAVHWFYARARQADPHLGLLRALKDPTRFLRYARVANRGIAEYGRQAEQLWGVSPRRQLQIYLSLFRRFGHTIEEFYLYRLCSPEWRPHAAAFLPWRRMRVLDQLYGSIGIDVDLLRDKACFARHCDEIGLPPIPTVLEFDSSGEPSGEASRGPSLPDGDIVAKPRLGIGGLDVEAFDKVSGGYRDQAGRVMGAQELIATWRKQSTECPLIVQARVRNAPEVSVWSTGALCTVRVVTTRAGKGTPVPLLGLLRMPFADAVADNITRGGILSTIDLASGELGLARTFEIPDAIHRREFERHPVTGTPITGRRLSCWNEIVELTVRAHQKFGAFHSIGWDVAITDKGLVLIEGNHDWGTMIAQYPGPGPLGWTRLPEDIRQCFDVPAAQGARALASTVSHSVR